MIIRAITYTALMSLLLLVSGCNFQQQADAKFGDQHFKTAIALIELHHTRFGNYPESLAELKYTGDWDQIALQSVQYKRLGNGYELNLVRGWVGAPQLSFPPEFWGGLGIVSSNVAGVPSKPPGA